MKNWGWRQYLIIGVAVIAVLILGRALEWWGGSKGIEVELAAAEVRTIQAKVSNSGVIQPDVEVPISPDVSGEVVSVHVKEGEYVRKGQLLFTIRPDNLKAVFDQSMATLNTSRADYANAKAALVVSESNRSQDSINLERNRPLFEQKVISQQDWENLKLRYRVSSAQVEQNKQQMQAAYFRIRSAEATNRQAADNLSRTSVYASMAGTVTKMEAKVGQRAVGVGMMAGTEIAKVADLTRMEVIVDVNENDIVNVNIGDSAQVEVDAFPNKRFKARVTEIAYSANVSGLGNVDQITNYKVSVLIEPSSYLKDADVMRGIDPRNQSPFRPGMTAVVNVFTEQAPNVVAVPLGAVTIDRSGEGDKAKPQASGAPAAPGAGAQPSSKSLANIQRSQEIVYVYDSTTKKVSAVPVSSGLADDDYIEIKKGLESGQRVVKGPYQAVAKLLKDGTVVRVKKAESRRKSS